MVYDAIQTAKWFLAYNRIVADDEGGELLSNLKLQKLLYYAQGCFLAVNGKPLFYDDIVAWVHGSVVESIFQKYKEYGHNGIPFEDDFDFFKFSKEENDLLMEVFNTFGQYSAWKLRDMTHHESPWKETPLNEVISTQKLKLYFQKEYMT